VQRREAVDRRRRWHKDFLISYELPKIGLGGLEAQRSPLIRTEPVGRSNGFIGFTQKSRSDF
jgi:hypothetical protein